MGKGIILRVLNGVTISPEVQSLLSKQLPNYQIEYFTEQPDYRKSVQRRINSLNSAFAFLMSAYPPDPTATSLSMDTIKNYVAQCKAACDLNKTPLEELHKELEWFASELASVISSAWRWPKGREAKDAIAALNEAEQYMLMGQGRYDLATLIPSSYGDSSELILQWDESIPPYYDQFIEELSLVKAQGYPKTPLWFRTMPEYQKAYLCHCDNRIKNSKDMAQEMSRFVVYWSEIKKTILNINSDLDAIKEERPPYPFWFKELNQQLKAMIRVLAQESKKFDEQIKSFRALLEEESKVDAFNVAAAKMSQFPMWYWELSDIQQHFLEYVLRNAVSVKEAVSFLPSRHRTLPAPANFAEHQLFKIDEEGIHRVGSKRRRSSHIFSRDVLGCSQETQMRHSVSNFTKVTEESGKDQLILFQTLISPMPEFVSDYLDLPDRKLNEGARATLKEHERAKNTFQHNHLYNIGKYIYPTQNDDPDSLKLIAEARKRYADPVLKELLPGLKELVDHFEKLVKSSFGTGTIFDNHGRELFLSSLEQLIIHHLKGFSYGSCVSGKDRKGIELIHTDSMMLFKDKFNRWPEFGEPEDSESRKAFVKIVVDLYCSRHQQEHAGQNAPGSEGIKTPTSYFPNDICEAINKRIGNPAALSREDKLATDNEVKNIHPKLRSIVKNRRDRLLCQLTLRQIGEQKCTQLYDALSALINEKSRFTTDSWGTSLFKVGGTTPTGILAIQNILADERYSANVNRLEEVFFTVLSRPEENSTRTDATKSVYNRIREILIPSPKNPSLTLDNRVDNAINEWQRLFGISKSANAGILMNI